MVPFSVSPLSTNAYLGDPAGHRGSGIPDEEIYEYDGDAILQHYSDLSSLHSNEGYSDAQPYAHRVRQPTSIEANTQFTSPNTRVPLLYQRLTVVDSHDPDENMECTEQASFPFPLPGSSLTNSGRLLRNNILNPSIIQCTQKPLLMTFTVWTTLHPFPHLPTIFHNTPRLPFSLTLNTSQSHTLTIPPTLSSLPMSRSYWECRPKLRLRFPKRLLQTRCPRALFERLAIDTRMLGVLYRLNPGTLRNGHYQ